VRPENIQTYESQKTRRKRILEKGKNADKDRNAVRYENRTLVRSKDGGNTGHSIRKKTVQEGNLTWAGMSTESINQGKERFEKIRGRGVGKRIFLRGCQARAQ